MTRREKRCLCFVAFVLCTAGCIVLDVRVWLMFILPMDLLVLIAACYIRARDTKHPH